MTKQIYLDNAATSFPKAPGVAEAVANFLNYDAVNVSRGGYGKAYDLQEKILNTRERLLSLFHAPDDACICFTGGATAALNQFLKGTLRGGDHILVTGMEHNSVMRPLVSLKKEGVEFSVLPSDSYGRPDLNRFAQAVRKNTKAVLCTHASNVTGTLMPVGEIGKCCRERGLIFAVDAAQTAGTYPIDMTKMGIDFLAFPGHKGLLGPQGVGGFAVRKPLAAVMRPLMEGGTGSSSDSETQPEFLPDRFECGTLPLPAIVGLRQALIYLEQIGVDAIREREVRLTERFLSGLRELRSVRVAGIAGPGELENRTGVVSVDFRDIDNGMAAFALEREYGILTRVGLHCAPRAHKTVGTWPQGTVRFSFGFRNTMEDVDAALHAIRDLVRTDIQSNQ